MGLREGYEHPPWQQESYSRHETADMTLCWQEPEAPPGVIMTHSLTAALHQAWALNLCEASLRLLLIAGPTFQLHQDRCHSGMWALAPCLPVLDRQYALQFLLVTIYTSGLSTGELYCICR